MAFPLLPATLGLIAAGLAALDYFLPPEPANPAPPTFPIAPPFEPPFEGGQCTGVIYLFDLSRNGNVVQSFSSLGGQFNFYFNSENTAFGISTSGGNTPLIDAIGNFPEYSITNIRRQDGQSDNCGNLPNPNPPYPIGGTGLADSPEPNLDEGAEPLVEGLVPANLAALLAAALAAMQAAESIAALAAALADAIRAIKDVIDELKPENRDRNKSKFKFDFGEIQKDGYLKFYGTNNNPNFEAIYLDILFTEEPIGIGKYFGSKSPNRYIYDRLGYIAFVSPSLGVMEVRELEFYRCSLSIPKDCVGFFYHLGLNGAIKANASAVYELKLEPIEEEE